jgi:hypothetical protein
MNDKCLAVLFDVNHTLIGIKREQSTQYYAIGVLYREVSKRKHLKVRDRASARCGNVCFIGF